MITDHRDVDTHRSRYRGPASGMTVLAHLFGILATILMLVWLLHYRGGIDLASHSANIAFNVHPFLMFSGFIFIGGHGMMAYRTVRADWQVRKYVHMFFHLIAIVLGIVGLQAAFKFHQQSHLTNMYSLHSWIGIGTFSFFCLQWLLSWLLVFLPRDPLESDTKETVVARQMVVAWHKNSGRALLFMAICTALTGLMDKASFFGLQHQREARLVNFLALTILLFGITVDLSLSLEHYT